MSVLVPSNFGWQIIIIIQRKTKFRLYIYFVSHLLFNSPSKHMTPKQRRFDVGATSWRRIDVETTLFKVMCLLGFQQFCMLFFRLLMFSRFKVSHHSAKQIVSRSGQSWSGSELSVKVSADCTSRQDVSEFPRWCSISTVFQNGNITYCVKYILNLQDNTCILLHWQDYMSLFLHSYVQFFVLPIFSLKLSKT